MKHTRNILLAFVLCLSMLFSFAGCAKQESTVSSKPSDTSSSVEDSTGDAAPYKFVLMAPLTGNNAQYGRSYQVANRKVQRRRRHQRPHAGIGNLR